jgi:hypothetical protein
MLIIDAAEGLEAIFYATAAVNLDSASTYAEVSSVVFGRPSEKGSGVVVFHQDIVSSWRPEK